MNCGRGEKDHRAGDKACPVGKDRYSPFYENGQHFVDSGKPTLRSMRQFNKLVEQEERTNATIKILEREKAKVRAMTFEEVVTEVCEMLTEKTGLGIIVERPYGREEGQAEIHLTTLGGKIRLGYTSVTKYSNGSYGVAGTSAGCFMGNHSDADIRNMLNSDFKAIEEKANQEKV
jgi:hypothetical protein